MTPPTSSCCLLCAMLLLLVASAADAALLNASFTAANGAIKLNNQGVGFFGSTDNVSSSNGNGVYVKVIIPSVYSLFIQETVDILKTPPSIYWGAPFSLDVEQSQSSLQTCLYVVNAAGLAALNSTDFTTSTTTCPTLSAAAGVAVATVNSSQWIAQCQGYRYSDTNSPGAVGSLESFYNCQGSHGLPTAGSGSGITPIIYPTAQFGPPVAIPGESSTFYEVYFAYVVIGGNQGLAVKNVLMYGILTAQTALSPPPPPPPSTGSALQLMPAAWTLALALFIGQMVLQLTRNSLY